MPDGREGELVLANRTNFPAFPGKHNVSLTDAMAGEDEYGSALRGGSVIREEVCTSQARTGGRNARTMIPD
jgi:hypothetical protein